MKKLIFAVALMAMSQTAFSQTTKAATSVTSQTGYEKIMAEKIAKLYPSQNSAEITALSNDFARIAAKETKRWEPNYYAALAVLQNGRMAMQSGKNDTLDATADEAQKYVDAAKAVSPDNAELYILEKMIHRYRMIVNPVARFMTEGAAAEEALSKAEKLDPGNPRITLLRAEDAYYTPEQFGGSKTQAMELFRKAKEQFKNYKPKNSLSPNWGEAEADYFLSQAK